MHTAGDALGIAIEKAADMVTFFTEDLKGSDWLHRPCENAVPAAWIVGHLTLSGRRMMALLGGDSSALTLPEGFEQRFARDETAPHAKDYGDLSNLRALFKAQHELFSGFARTFVPEQLNKPTGHANPRFATPGDVLSFAPSHISMHAGQISTIRRSLGRKPLV